MEEQVLTVFFDESGKGSDKPNLMGGLLIPEVIYKKKDFETLTQELRGGALKLHFKNYSGDSTEKTNFLKVSNTLAKYFELIKCNIIYYNYSALTGRKEFTDILIEDMIYTKFPERIMYGLLRGYGENTHISAKIFIEKSKEYETLSLFGKLTLDQIIEKQLNVQTLYRAEKFKVSKCELVPKCQQIGVEMTDMLLGVVRTILINSSTSKKKREKNILVMEMLKNSNFLSLIKNMKYYEWKNTNDLYEVDFAEYVQLFISSNYEYWFQE